jgi:hypothetical protein
MFDMVTGGVTQKLWEDPSGEQQQHLRVHHKANNDNDDFESQLQKITAQEKAAVSSAGTEDESDTAIINLALIDLIRQLDATRLSATRGSARTGTDTASKSNGESAMDHGAD